MKKILLSSAIALSAALVFFSLGPAKLISFGGEAPTSPGATGSMTDGRNCTACHVGTPSATSGIIMHDIPSSGWEAGETYNFTVQATSGTAAEFGFQITAENGSGGKQGFFNTTGGTTVKIQSGGAFATHNGPRTATGGGASWTFTWQAPPVPAITGDITFSCAVNAANDDGATSGDMIMTDAVTLPEDTGMGSAIVDVRPFQFEIGPNPSVDFININTTLFAGDEVEMHIFNMNGSLLNQQTLGNATGLSSSFSTQDLISGTYFIRLSQGDYSQTQKFVKL